MSYVLTTQTGFSALPLDCLQEIFQYLENDMTSLYRCILINRIWCRIIISLLWRRPFEYSGSKSTRRYAELIRTYITCLSRAQKKEIYFTGYDIPDHPRPLFFYHQYLKELDCQKLDEAVEEWIVKYGFKEIRPEDPENIVYTELLRLLLSRGKGLWRLRLGQYKDKYDIPAIGKFTRIKYTLANLRGFEFLGEMNRLNTPSIDNIYHFLKKLSNISNKLEYINVDMTEDEESFSGKGLQELIASQKNLSFFRYNQENSRINNSKDFFKALSHNANTLKNIEFNSIPLNVQCLNPLEKFNNLECIQFAYCFEKNNEDYENEISEEIIDHSPQLKVEKLIFHKSDLNSVSLEVLRLVNTSVKELTVDNIVPDLFEFIFKHCPNIKYLATAISQKYIESLSFLSANKIEHLILKTLKYGGGIETKDFQQLGKSLFLSLRHLSLHFNVSVEELSFLLKECQSPLESLCLKFNIETDDDLNKDEYLKVVTEFAKKDGSLKEFKFFLEFGKDMKVKDSDNIFSKDILTEAKLIIPNISRETQDPFAYIDMSSKVSDLLGK